MTATLVERIEWIIMHIEDKDDVLDVGCAGDDPRRMGNPDDKSLLHPRIAERTGSILGIDVNLQGVGRMQTLGYNIICANAENFVSNRKFDVVVLGECIEHTDNPGFALDCARENLKDGGILIVTTPNARHLGVALKEMLTENHTHIYTPKLLSRTLARRGFKVVELQFFKGRKEWKLNLVGKLYEHVFLRLFPQLAPHFGVVAEKIRGD